MVSALRMKTMLAYEGVPYLVVESMAVKNIIEIVKFKKVAKGWECAFTNVVSAVRVVSGKWHLAKPRLRTSEIFLLRVPQSQSPLVPTLRPHRNPQGRRQ